MPLAGDSWQPTPEDSSPAATDTIERRATRKAAS